MSLLKKPRKNRKANLVEKDAPMKADFKKLKLIVTVVNRNKTEFFLDYLTTFGVNFQTAVAGQGTAKSETLYLLGLEDSDKGIIFSVINEDKAPEAMQGLEEKFHTIRNGKGIAFTVPLTSVIGVAIYRFLSNNRK